MPGSEADKTDERKILKRECSLSGGRECSLSGGGESIGRSKGAGEKIPAIVKYVSFL